MAGINRASKLLRMFTESQKSMGVPCVFISHQQNDKAVCRRISEYIKVANIDVYFDDDDLDLKLHNQSNNPKGVVNSIRKGIKNSSHMLVVISPNTLYSKWVPWEVGYGYDETDLGILTITGISDADLPDYLRTTEIYRGIKSLNAYLSKITGRSQLIMESEHLIKKHTMSSHPLERYLDWNK